MVQQFFLWDLSTFLTEERTKDTR